MTLIERLRVELSCIADEECYNVGQHQLMFLRQSEARELRDALDAQAERIKELIAALEYWLPDEAELDKYSREAQDAWNKHIDILQRAREALKEKP